jgi:uncharacterized glyoxalase superfamily protein PhnB
VAKEEILRTEHEFKPRGWPTVIPRIVVSDARGLTEFIRHVFGATGDYLSNAPAVLQLGESRVMISDSGARETSVAFLYVYVADADETYRRALSAGASSLEAPSNLPYGDRRGMILDKWGNTWQIATRLNADA